MKVNIADLISRIEYLGLNSSPIRNLVALHNSGQINGNDYEHLLVTLKDQSYRPFPGGSEPLAIRLLLGQLGQNVDNDLKKSPATISTVEPQKGLEIEDVKKVVSDSIQSLPSSDNSDAILSAIGDLANQVKNLKTQQILVDGGTDRTISSTSPKVEMEQVFIDPIDPAKEIKANVSIDSVKTTNAKSKLERLKKLKGE